MVDSASLGRREPPPFRRLTAVRLQHLGPRMVRLTLAGDELAGFELEKPAASVRLLIPSAGANRLEIPQWNGNEFLLADGRRPVIRTLTPRNLRPHGLDLDVVVHPDGVLSMWIETAPLGVEAAISGPGRGYNIEGHAQGFVLIGDETAVPAIGQLLEHIPGATPVEARLVVGEGFGQIELPVRADADVVWCEMPVEADRGAAMIASLQGVELSETKRIWCAGEAEAMQALRNYLFQECALPRSLATVRGYWKARG